MTGDTSPQRAAMAASQLVASRPRSMAVRLMLVVCAALVFASFTALGTWQLKRLYWKLDLIERVAQRVHAAAVAAPASDRWPQITAQSDEYRHVRVTGIFLDERTVRVQAVTELGSGFWLLTPLQCADGSVVLINRGFIPTQAVDATRHDSQNNLLGGRNPAVHAAPPASGVSTVTGLLRMSEPGGAFLRHNDPAANRWYSRDVQAIAAARGLTFVAPYFVDADAAKESAGEQAERDAPNSPVGGLTVVAFHNNHLVYAITWYALALMVALASWRVAREERRLPRRGADAEWLDQEIEDGKHD